MIRERADALLYLTDALFFTHQRQIAELAAKGRLPSLGMSYYPDVGGLMSFGVDTLDLERRAATFVDRILKGAKPGDLPVAQPTKFELVINLKTAKLLGLAIPSALLARADMLIE